VTRDGDNGGDHAVGRVCSTSRSTDLNDRGGVEEFVRAFIGR
jgi:hypothetical protein